MDDFRIHQFPFLCFHRYKSFPSVHFLVFSMSISSIDDKLTSELTTRVCAMSSQHLPAPRSFSLPITDDHFLLPFVKQFEEFPRRCFSYSNSSMPSASSSTHSTAAFCQRSQSFLSKRLSEIISCGGRWKLNFRLFRREMGARNVCVSM